MFNKIQNSNHIVVIAHVNPDADSLGSASAFYTYLLTLHKKVSFFCASKNINKKFSYLPWYDNIKNKFPVSADLVISLDCGSKNRLGVEFNCKLINIDHHSSNNNFGDFNLVDSSCISTTQLLYNFFTDNNIKINKKMATALYTGLLDDSNGFLDDSVDGTVFALVNKLINLGADYKIANKYIKKYISLSGLRLKGKMLQDLELLHDAKIAFFTVLDSDMKITGAEGSDCEYALEESLYLPTVEIAILLKQNSNFSVKGSIRCVGSVDASKIAKIFSGGGHRSRAGFDIKTVVDIKELKEKILKLIKEEI